ncbi:MAG: polysaccharide biosynthesis protein [Defluviitaleaceae bacterium]|nr:polysaccharide biosynthesis protein [Defluviitaleaceae bacterium]
MSENKPKSNNSFVRQAAILGATGILARLLGFLYRLPLTDLIGDDGNGIYAVGFSVYTFLLVLSSAGLPSAIAKMVAERSALGHYDAAHRVFRVALGLAAVIGVVVSVIVFFLAEQITGMLLMPQATLALQMLTPTIFIVAIMSVIRGYFQGMSTTVPTALSQLIEQIINAIFSVVLAHAMWNFAMDRGYELANFGAAGGTLGSTVGAMAGFIFITGLYFIARKDILHKVNQTKASRKLGLGGKYREEKTSRLVRSILRTSFTIIAGTAVFSIAGVIDVWLVPSRLLVAGFDHQTATEFLGQVAGKFNTLTNVPAAISSSIAIATIPAIAAARKLGNKQEVQEKLNVAFRVGMLLTIPIAFGLAVLGPQIVALLFPSHPDGGTLFRWGFLSVIFLAASQISTGVLQALNFGRVPVFSAICGAIVKIVMSFVLISSPNINIYGAVIGTTLCFLVSAVINCAFLFKHTNSKPDVTGMLIKPAIASTAMAIGCFGFYHLLYILFGQPTFATITAIIIGMVLYVVFMLVVRGLSDQDILFLPGGGRLLAKMKSKGLI